MPKIQNSLNFIDVFAGAGGLSCGLEMAGHRCLLGVDIDKYAMQTFAKNHRFAETYTGPIQELDKKKLNALLDNQTVHAVVGGPPCQGFSTVGAGDPKDVRNSLFLQFVRLVKLTKPHFVVVENVTGLLAQKNEKSLQAIFKQFTKLGYNLDVQVLSSQNYGAPEIRRRTIIIGTKLNSKAVFPVKTHDLVAGKTFIPPVTVGDAFKDLKTKSGHYLNHDIDAAAIKNKLDLKRLKRIPEGKGIRYQKDEEAYLTPSLSLNVDWSKIRENRFRQTKYQRLDRNRPSPTIMTHRHGYFHPTEHRYLTQREAAKLQSFPNHFEFVGPVSAQWRQIGNAVPPMLGRAIGKCLSKMYKQSLTGETTKSITKKSLKETIHNVREKAFVYKEKRSL
jgi:DNA (cytosine-5)-methyltransferase 1